MNHHETLQRLLSATLICSAALLLVLILRPLLRRHGGAQLVYASWLLLPLALVASLLPYPAAPLPALSLVSSGATFSTGAADGVNTAWWSSPSTWLLIWLAGAAALMVWMGWRQWRFRRQLGPLQLLRPLRSLCTSQSLAAQPPIYRAGGDATAGPLLLGLLRPKMVVPANFQTDYTAQEQALIVAHEQVHLQRGDLPALALASTLQIVFWFNPLLHCALGRFRFDQEAACDAAVLQRHPQSRPAYAAAILKVQMASWAGSGAPLACQWQSGHPLKARIQLLAQTDPSPVRRAAARGTLAACTLAACLGAWAAEQAPAVSASASASAPEAAVATATTATTATMGKRYKVAFTGVNEIHGQNRISVQMDLALQAGERMQLWPEWPAQPNKLNCKITLELRDLPPDRVEIKLPFSCDGSAVRNPRLITGLGERASLRTGSKAAGEHEYSFTMVVTPWPETTPWPR